MKTTFVLLLSLATAYGATHVNISIAQQPVTNPADVTYVDGKAPAELKAGPTGKSADLKYATDSNEGRSAQLRVANNNANFNYDMRNDEMNSGFSNDGRSARIEMAGNKNQMQEGGGNMQFYNAQTPMKTGHAHHAHGHERMSQRQRQFRPQNAQEKQNQAFERYIQSYHSGPTVETVFETSSPAPQRYQQSPSSFSSSSAPQRYQQSPSSFASTSSSESSRPARIQTFERQVALPAEATKEQPAAAAEHQPHAVALSQPKPITEVTKESEESKTPPLIVNTVPLYDLKRVSNKNAYDPTNYDQSNSYDKTNFDQHNFGYEDGHDSNFHNQYLPPAEDEPQGGYSDFYDQGGFYGSSHNNFYPQQPTYQRPVVTKTIQIAQPALKAKKFEIRHPAIQKEFYDIEERVLIKPAGTVVVELDHPVAKIPRGETILPLGHPHPAVASAYSSNDGGVVQHQISSSGSYNGGHDETDSSGYNNQQYNPTPMYKTKPQRDGSITTLGSSITATPSNDQHTKDATVEANLSRQFSGEAQLVATSQSGFDENKQKQNLEQNRYYIATDSHGNQRKIQSKHITPKMFKSEESSVQYPAHVEFKENGAPSAPSAFNQEATNGERQFFYPNTNHQQGAVFAELPGNLKNQESTNGQLNSDSGNEDEFKGEYLSNDFYNKPQDFKPARLRELAAPEPSGTHTHIIKHEHNIHLPPAQHNIFLGRLEHNAVPNQHEQKSADFEESPAHVSEIKPYLQRHNGPIMVYATTKVRPTGRYTDAQAQRFIDADRRRVQIDHQRGQLRNENEGPNRVQYSAPYSNMRYHPEQSARLTYDNPYAYENQGNLRQMNRNKENLKLEEKAFAGTDNKPLLEDGHKTHIQIQIPHLPQEADKPIIVSSTISPPVHSERTGKYRAPLRSSNDYEQSPLEQPDLAGPERQSANLEIAKPDCEQPMKQSARYEIAPANVNHYHQQQPFNQRSEQHFSRIVEDPKVSEVKDRPLAPAPVTKVQANNIDVSLKSTAGHVATPGSRVIAATPAPTDAAAGSESFHKRRIVVNHPFQTVREVVEHEPITNYHQVQVNEPASPALYRLPYTQTHGALRQVHTAGVPVVYHHSASTHGNLQYAVPSAIPANGLAVSYNRHD